MTEEKEMKAQNQIKVKNYASLELNIFLIKNIYS